MENLIWIFLLIYLGAQLGIGYWVSRRIASDSDYFLAGRNLGLTMASVSMFATWFGAETCMGSSAAIYAKGLSGSRADPFGYSFCLLLYGLFLAKPLRDLRITTLGDFFRLRYSRSVELMAIFVMLPTSLMWAAAQIRAFGQILATTGNVNVNLAITIAALFVVAYTSMGGLLADVITDVLQGVILVLGLGLLFFSVTSQSGGVVEVLSRISSEQLNFFGGDEGVWHRLDTWAIPIVGSLVAQELVSRSLATRSGAISRRASFVAAAIYFSVGAIPAILGLIGPHLSLNLAHTDQFLPTLARSYLGPAGFIVFIGALVSAILSTVDSTILTVSAFVTHNILGPRYAVIRPSRQLWISRSIVVGAGTVAYVMALAADGIYELVQAASAFGSSGVVVVTIVGIWWKEKASVPAALGALLVSVVASLSLARFDGIQAPFLVSLSLSVMVYVGLAIWFSRGQTPQGV